MDIGEGRTINVSGKHITSPVGVLVNGEDNYVARKLYQCVTEWESTLVTPGF